MKKKSSAVKANKKSVKPKGSGKARKPLIKAKNTANRLIKKAILPITAKLKSQMAPARSKNRLAAAAMTEGQIRRMPNSAYMNEIQLEYFRARLLQQRLEVLSRQSEVKDRLNQHENFADPADRASAEEEHWLDLRLRERESMLLRKLDDALRRITEREYGYCKVTGEAIGIPRLLARPTAEVCVDVKGQNEHVEAQFRDR